jgi:hypothetical protein
MHGSQRALLGVTAAVILGLLTLTGCDWPWEEDEPGTIIDPPVTPDRDTALQVIQVAFPDAYAGRDSIAYAACLDDRFEFVFLESDRNGADLPPGEIAWGLTQELHSAGNLFRAANIVSITLDLTPVLQAVDDTAFDDKPAGETWYKIRTDTDLRVLVRSPDSGDETMFWVTNQQEFTVRPDARPGHDGLWVIRQHRELDIIGRRAESTTWGSVKSLYDR